MLELSQIWSHLDHLTKPARSLGQLEVLAAQLCRIQQTLAPRTRPRRLVLFAGDHGVVDAGVTIWPASVTEQMLSNIVSGGAASSVLARQTGTELVVIDVGSRRDGPHAASEPNHPQSAVQGVAFLDCRVRRGTRNLAVEPALSVEEFQAAFEIGRDQAFDAKAGGISILVAGEMGIGNTTPAACLCALLADMPAENAVGRGAGADDETLFRKMEVVSTAVSRARPDLVQAPLSAIAQVCGLEIAAMAGLFVGGRAAGLTIILDGFVATAAALIAERLFPDTAASMIASHEGAEPGHKFALAKLGLTPYLHWDMRLGEGTGALLLLPLLDAAAAIVQEMATFDSAGIGKGGKRHG